MFWDRVLWSGCDHRACEVINPTKERGPKHCTSSITELLYTSIKLSISVTKSFCVGLLIIIKCLEHQFIPKHSAYRSFAAYDVSLYTGPVALDNVVYCSSVDDS